MSRYAVGIDLGNTNSRVAVYRNGNVEIIENELGCRSTPTSVTFTDDGVLTGQESIEECHNYLTSTVFEARCLIGKKFSDPMVQEDIKRFPYVVENELGTPKIKITLKNAEPKEYCPEEISAFILRRMKIIAEARLKQEINRAVVTVPAYFNDAQRQATKHAATIAGFKTVNVINEPTAAALAFNHQNKKEYKRNIVVYDFGRSTFHASVVIMGRGKCEVKSTKSDCHLGGIDIDMNLVKYIRDGFKAKYGKEMATNDWINRRLKHICKRVKKKLSTQLQTDIEFLFSSCEDYIALLSRARFERLNLEIFNKTFKILDECLKGSGIEKDDIDEVVLVGGSSRIPKIQAMLADYFGSEKINKKINPAEAIAYGAAIHATTLAGDKNEVLDVTSLSLGTNTYGDLMSVIIPRNTPIPAKSIKRYQTIIDNQTIMKFPIYQGEREIASENYELGSFTMTDLTEAPAKSVQVEVCYRIDAEGLLHISATEINFGNKNNKKEIQIDVQKKGLSEEQIGRSIKEAEMNKEKNANRLKLAVERKNADAHAENRKVEDREALLNKNDGICKRLEKAKIEDVD